MKYQTPSRYFFHLHHIRPRFKFAIEHVLIYMATEISKIGEQYSPKFKELVIDSIRKFPGNNSKSIKTINNWRTEISSLFGFIQNIKAENKSRPGLRAIELAENQDLINSFKILLYFFQYPGGHLKARENAKIIKQGIRFKPAQFILSLLSYAGETEKKRIGISKAEAAHCIFNDLRVTKDGETADSVWRRIKTNRQSDTKYFWQGKIIRYAGDILDYMVTANLLVKHGKYFFINPLEQEAVLKFINSGLFFDKYNNLLKKHKTSAEEINELQEEWVSYINQPVLKDFFRTDILAFISADEKEYHDLKKRILAGVEDEHVTTGTVSAKEIGDIGENLVHSHERMRIKTGGRSDLINKIQCYANQLALGYDIQSVELDESKRYIEVKTTISQSEIDFSRFHLTTNEWIAAESMRGRYFVYRLLLSKKRKKLFLLRDPVGQYKRDNISMAPRNGADVMFNPGKSGEYTELLEWKD